MDFNYKIIRTDRKRTASIQVSPSNEVTVMVPKELPSEKLEALLRRKTPWILSKIKFNQEVKYPHKPKEFVSGEAFQYLGRNYRLKIETGEIEGVELKNGRLNVRILGDKDLACHRKVKRLLTDWYARNAARKLKERIVRHSDKMSLNFRRLKIKDLKRCWASCSMKGDITFNWKIIMAPLRIVDYVVVHELCHRAHHNHSKEFWNLLGRMMPDYKEQKEWLRVNGAGLGI